MSSQCRAFTKALKDLYKSVNSDEKVFEVIFITNEEEESIRESLNRMPWYYWEHDENDTKDLRDIFNAYVVPKLGIITNNGRVLYNNIQIDKLNKDNFLKWIQKGQITTNLSHLKTLNQIKHKYLFIYQDIIPIL
jgi:hypothetical protein